MQNNSGAYSDINKLAGKVYFTILSVNILWFLLIFAAPYLESLGGNYESISGFIYLFFSKVCHQDDLRSFHLFGLKLAVCSRCLWIYAGFFLGVVIYPLRNKIGNFDTPSVIYLFIPAILLFLDVLLDIAGVVKNSFFSRSATGLLTGFVLPFFIIPGFVKFFYEVNSFLRNKISYKN
ncbi:MAG: DUF2085 domain-containing protein [Ignavibacteria bacterium]|nr:DUF2085 domain-containing protein [Ignavibacteria bacterium]MBL0108474.1 DUF2085 domain-containing protein [Ignavibacteria bacterium]